MKGYNTRQLMLNLLVSQAKGLRHPTPAKEDKEKDSGRVPNRHCDLPSEWLVHQKDVQDHGRDKSGHQQNPLTYCLSNRYGWIL